MWGGVSNLGRCGQGLRLEVLMDDSVRKRWGCSWRGGGQEGAGLWSEEIQGTCSHTQSMA